MAPLAYQALINRELPLQDRGCGSKAVFASRREARHLASHGRHMGSGLRPYRCRFCDGWHLGHRKPRHRAPLR
jgi:hypothetical protein